jgi:ribonuclease E
MLENEPSTTATSTSTPASGTPASDAAAPFDGAAAPDGKAPAKRTAGRRTSAAKKAVPVAEAAVPPDAPSTGSSAEAAPRKAGARKTAAKKSAGAAPRKTAEAPPHAPAESDQAVSASPATRRRRTASGARQAAVQQGEPGEPGSSGAAEPAHTVASPSIPTVLFQAPQPQVPSRAARPAAGEHGVADEHGAPDAAGSPNDGTEREGGRRRRRGGRGRRGPGDATAEAPEGSGAGSDSDSDKASDAPAAERAEGEGAQPRRRPQRAAADDDERADGDSESSSSRRRRRRRRRGAGGDGDEHAPDDPPNTVVRIREPREHDDHAGVQGVKGSTRLEAKKQRRREGREQIRRGRRGSVITEAEFLARRESVDRVMVVRQRDDRTQIGVLEDGVLVEHFVSNTANARMVGNVYLGRVQNVLPGMEAAFVDIGKGRNAVLYAGEVNFDMSGMEGQPRRIESALKSGQTVLVQVTKDPIGHKGARLTSQVSLPGRYLVYVPEGSMMGISRKLPDVERSRLKAILKAVMPEGAGVIVRTAAEGASEEELARDVARLSAQWEDIKRKSEKAEAPALLYGEPDLTIRVIRDVFNEDFNSLVVQADSEWDTVEAYVGHVAPDLVSRLSRWTSEEDVFTQYRVDEQIAKALDRKVWLPSGGYLIIDRTEAMIVIDVNTGRFVGKGGNLEETVTKNNLEAAEEIVRQLRLRDIGGIIVIDFIDMVLESNRDLVLRRLVECLGRDRTKHQVAEVTSLGLVQMTRKRVGNGLLEAFSETCETCNGRGVIVHTDPVEHRPARVTTPKPAPPRSTRGKRSDAGRTPVDAGASVAAEAPADGSAGTDAVETGGAAASGGGSRTRRGGRRRGGAKSAVVSDHTADGAERPEPADHTADGAERPESSDRAESSDNAAPTPV